MTDIESKLSAIKAINEEKELLENGLSELISRSSKTDNWVIFKVPVPNNIVREMDIILIEYFNTRKAELIAKAEAIMKSEAS
jgi:hypothetical protein